MRHEKNSDGTYKFTTEEYLSWQQTASYFSWYAAKQRKELILGRSNEDLEEDLQNDEYVNDPVFDTTEEILEKAVQNNKDDIFQ